MHSRLTSLSAIRGLYSMELSSIWASDGVLVLINRFELLPKGFQTPVQAPWVHHSLDPSDGQEQTETIFPDESQAEIIAFESKRRKKEFGTAIEVQNALTEIENLLRPKRKSKDGYPANGLGAVLEQRLKEMETFANAYLRDLVDLPELNGRHWIKSSLHAAKRFISYKRKGKSKAETRRARLRALIIDRDALPYSKHKGSAGRGSLEDENAPFFGVSQVF